MTKRILLFAAALAALAVCDRHGQLGQRTLVG